MNRTDDEYLALLKRIKETWRWHHHYTGIFADGWEYKTANPDDIPTENLLGIYNGSVELDQLKEDLDPA